MTAGGGVGRSNNKICNNNFPGVGIAYKYEKQEALMTTASKPIRVLNVSIARDEPSTLGPYAEIMFPQEFNFLSVDGYHEGMRALEKEEVDVVISNTMLGTYDKENPESSDIKPEDAPFLLKNKANELSAKFVFLSTRTFPSEAPKFMVPGVDLFFNLPETDSPKILNDIKGLFQP